MIEVFLESNCAVCTCRGRGGRVGRGGLGVERVNREFVELFDYYLRD